MIRLCEILVYRNELPFVIDDAVSVVVHDDVETAYLIGAHSRLGDQYLIHPRRLLQYRVRVAAHDDVDPPFRPHELRQLNVRLEAYVGQQDGEIDVVVLVGVGYFSDLAARLLQRHEAAYELILLDGIHDLLGDYPREQYVESGLVNHQIGAHQALVVQLDVKVCVDDGEIGHFFEE